MTRPPATDALTFNDNDSPADLLDALLLTRFVEGVQPFAEAKRLDRVRDEATLLPPGVGPARAARGDGQDSVLAEGEGWTIRSIRWTGGGALVTVTAATPELATQVLAQALTDAESTAEPVEDRVDIGFWHATAHGPRRRVRSIDASTWDEIRRNYSPAAARAFDTVVALTPQALAGRLLLVHGPPGTGKTTVLRCLARQWRQWCQLDCVLDPERLFADPGYLIEVIMGEDDDERWRLLLLEDCDELISGGAKRETGQALSRLLNLTDGMLGQGRRILVAITTNEDIATLHPAVTRPGRCLAQVEVGPLPRAEAVRWLGHADGVPDTGATLAELLALRDGTGPVSTAAPIPATGLYL